MNLDSKMIERFNAALHTLNEVTTYKNIQITELLEKNKEMEKDINILVPKVAELNLMLNNIKNQVFKLAEAEENLEKATIKRIETETLKLNLTSQSIDLEEQINAEINKIQL